MMFCSSPNSANSDEDRGLNLAEAKRKIEPMAGDTRTEQLIADALQQMTLKDREKLYHDIHGVAEDVDEKPDFVARALLEMEEELCRIKQLKNLPLEALQAAEQQNPSFVKDPEMRLHFLKTESYDAAKAAARFVRYFNFKMLSFGQERLCKEITRDDLNHDDQKLLLKGYFQLLPQCDRSGRSVGVGIVGGQNFGSPESLGRVMFYMFSDMAGDASRDKKRVFLIIHSDQNLLKDTDHACTKMFTIAGEGMPFSTSTYHHCFTGASPRAIRLLIWLLSMSADTETRARTKLHDGSYTEWQYNLMTYGIPHHLIPLTAEGKIKTKNHLEYLEMKRVQEAQRKLGNRNTILVPLPSDILFGKGKTVYSHPGNMHVQMIVQGYLDKYSNSNRHEKTALAAEVVTKVKAVSGRFLSKENGVWEEVSDTRAREKVSNMFRFQVRPARGEGVIRYLVPSTKAVTPGTLVMVTS